MAEYYNERSLLQGSTVPQFDVGALTKAGSLVQQALGSVRDRELETSKLEKEQKRYETDLAFKQRAEQRDIDRINKENQEKLATNEAMRAVLDPKGYQESKMAVEQKAVEDAYKLMSPEEVAAVKAQYDPTASGKQWLDVAQGAKGVDIGRMFDAKSRQYEIAAKTPGTPEYVAAENAKMELFKKEQDIAHKNRMAEIGAQASASRELATLGWDKPQALVDPTTGSIKMVKPSEMEKYPTYTTTPDLYSDKLKNQLEREEKMLDRDIKKSESENKAKKELAETLAKYDSGSNETVVNAVNVADEIIKEYNKGSKSPTSPISKADLNSLVVRSRAIQLSPFGRDDLDDDAFRRNLAGEISSRTGQPAEEILEKLSSLPQNRGKTTVDSLQD